MVDRQRPDDRVLGQIRVLVLVHQDVAVAVVQLSPQFVVLAQHHGHVQQQVVEVDRVGFEQQTLVDRIQFLGDDAGGTVLARHVVFRADQMVLGPTDRVGDASRAGMRRLDVAFGHGLLQHAQTVVRVVDRVVLLQSDQRRIDPQQPGTEGVKRAHPDVPAARQRQHALPHLVRRLVGERQGQDLVRRDPCRSRFATRCVTTRVLPLPGPARIKAARRYAQPPRAAPPSAKQKDPSRMIGRRQNSCRSNVPFPRRGFAGADHMLRAKPLGDFGAGPDIQL
jgi:hypothetical protein